MDIALIRPGEAQLHDDRLDPPLGLMYLSGALSSAGHSSEVVDLCGNRSYEDIPRADLYGISAFTTSYPEACRVLGYLRQREPTCIVVVGGPHVNAVEGRVLRDGFDVAFVGEAEVTFPQVIGQIGRRVNPAPIIRGKEATELDDLCFSFSSVDVHSYSRTVMNRPSSTLLTSRGCPFRCRFCWTPNNLGAVRFHSVDWVRARLMELKDQFGITAMTFHDDSFLADKARAMQIMDCLRDLDFIWRAECNICHLTKEMCEYMKATGCVHVFCGVESGSARMLRLMKKPQTQEIVARGVHNAVNAGLVLRASIMVGFPGETWDTVVESADFLCKLPFQEYSLYNFAPFPGTEPFEHPERFGIQWVSEDYEDFYLLKGFNEGNYSFATDTISPAQVREWREYMISRLNADHTPSVVIEGKWTLASER